VAAATVSSRLIGREGEVRALLDALADAADGRPSLAFVAGESGVGKTRLLSELARQAREQGARVLSGECVELGEGELPYAPLVGALRPLVRTGDPVLLDLPESARRELATLLPGLGAGLEDVPEHPDPRGGEAQPRLFEALLAALDAIARDVPLLLVVEDVHWADRSTRDFLSFLGRNLADERVLVAMSYRPDELHRRHPLRPLLAVLERSPHARRFELGGLRRDDVAGLARELLGSEPTREYVDRLHRRSDGNALFVEELVSSGPGPLPASLADALMVRIERLSPEAQEVVRVLAAAQPVDHALLEELAGMEAATLRQGLRDAIAGHVVTVGADDRYGFRHVLLREVVYDDLLPGERAALHLAVAHALERRLAENDDAGLAVAAAHHFHAAGDQPAALRSAVVAARAAARVHASGDAAALMERALELWERVDDPAALAGCDHVELLMATSNALRVAGEENRRLTLIQQAIREARAADPDDRRVPMMLRQRALAEWALGRGEASRSTLDLARRMLPDDAPQSDRDALTISRMKLANLQARFAEAVALGDELLEDTALTELQRSEVYNDMGHALIRMGRHDRGVSMLREAMDVARAHDNMENLGIAYTNLADALQLRGEVAEAAAIVDEGLAQVAETARGFEWVRLLAAELAIDRGDWVVADHQLGLIGRTTGGTRVNLELRRAELALGRGEHDFAAARIDDAEALLVDSLEPQFVAVAGVLRAELERRRGDHCAARGAIESALERMEYCSDDTLRLARLATTGVALEADAAQRARDLGDADEAQRAVQRAEMMLARAQAAAAEDGPLEVALARAAEAHYLRATGEPPGDAWSVAAETWDARSRPLSAATARRWCAEARLATADRDAAAEALRIALDEARRLGARWLVAELEGLAARGRLSTDARAETAAGNGAGTGADGAGDDDDPFGLTPRERQVLGLVARGATNREIGAELFMAEKTASVHVSRILAKLDVRSRTEAAAVAHRLGLAERQT
jgi:ATP/maltotriose-dependent transcriptional regulator MalT